MHSRAFPSTFEDEEEDELLMVPPSLSRGRTSGQDVSRSRSQSIAVTSTRPGAVGSPYYGPTAMQSWNETLTSNSLNIPGRFGEIKPPGSSRYGSLGPAGSSPNNNTSSSPSGGSVIGNGYSNRQNVDISNMSPFVRDVGQILLDEGSAFRELWAGMHVPRDENGGGGSGTTSRRHSVSVVQPRRGNTVGFNAPGNDGPDEPVRFTSAFGRGGLLLSDDDLAADLDMLSLSRNGPTPKTSSSQYPPSQPASLPIHAPISRSPPSRDILSPYQSINLTIPSGSSFSSRNIPTPSDGGLSAGGTSPSVSSTFEKHFQEQQYTNGSGSGRQTRSPELTARFIPGQGIQYQPRETLGSSYTRSRVASVSSPVVSPGGGGGGGRIMNPQQQPFYPQQQTQRRPSDAGAPSLNELGRGVPLHAVPSSWPLYIVEFKAGRTDLFYCTDPNVHIRIGDLVIVEADRGKDLGKVVNDSITIEQVEAFQRDQQERAVGVYGGGGGGGGGDGGAQLPSPGGTAGAGAGTVGKKEISPKMIYGKAQPQDARCVIFQTRRLRLLIFFS